MDKLSLYLILELPDEKNMAAFDKITQILSNFLRSVTTNIQKINKKKICMSFFSFFMKLNRL